MPFAEQAYQMFDPTHVTEQPHTSVQSDAEVSAHNDCITRWLTALRAWHQDRDRLERLHQFNQKMYQNLSEYRNQPDACTESTPLLDEYLAEQNFSYLSLNHGLLPIDMTQKDVVPRSTEQTVALPNVARQREGLGELGDSRMQRR